MNQPPNRKWAYALLERAKKRDPLVTPVVLRIAQDAVKLDQLGAVSEPEKIDRETGEVTA